MKTNISPLQAARSSYEPRLPKVLARKVSKVRLKLGKATQSIADQAEIRQLFPKTYGQPEVSFLKGEGTVSFKKPMKVALVLSGGQAPGGHNVVAGLFDGLKKLNPKNSLRGYLGGPSGLLENKSIEMPDKLLKDYRNTGGFDIIGSGRTKLETEEQFQTVAKNLKAAGITA